MKQVHIGGFTGCGGAGLRDAVTVSRIKKPVYKVVRAVSNLGFGDWLAAREPGDLVVCGFDAPAVAVAAALDRGERYEDALRTWLDEASQALALAEDEPGLMILVNISAVQADPESLARLLAARTGMRVQPAKGARRLASGLVYRPLAERLVAGRAEIDEIVEELSATALIDGGFEPTREQLHAALEAARLDAAARDQATREHAFVLRALANARAALDEAMCLLSRMGEPDDPDAARARESLEGLIAALQRHEAREPAAVVEAPGTLGGDTVADVESQTSDSADGDVADAIAEILELAAEDVRRAEFETQVLQDAMPLCSEEIQSRTLEPLPAGSDPVTGHDPCPQPEAAPEIVASAMEAFSSVRAAGVEAAGSAAPPVAGTTGLPAHPENTRAPNPVTLIRDYLVVRRSRLFDADWYLTWYADLQSVRDPAMHFVLHGAREGRAASAYFSAYQYRAENPDVARSGVNPLVHYELIGRKERRRVFPVVEAFQSQEKG